MSAGLVLAWLAAPLLGQTEFPFVDGTAEAGLARQARTYDAAAADFDLDGDVDLFIANHGEQPAFYVNDGRGRFSEQAKAWGMFAWDWHGVAFVDLNADAYPDLLLSCGAGRGEAGGANHAALNLKGRSFTSFARLVEPLADAAGRSRSILCRDFDGDGRTDILYLNYQSPTRLILTRFAGGMFSYVDASSHYGVDSIRSTKGVLTHLNADAQLDFAGASPPNLVFGRADGGFGPASEEPAFTGLTHVAAVDCGDVDGDGDDDVYVTRGLAVANVVVGEANKIFFELEGSGGKGKGFRVSLDGVDGIEAKIFVDGDVNPSHRFFGAAPQQPESEVVVLNRAELLALGSRARDADSGFGVFVSVDDERLLTVELQAGDRTGTTAAGWLSISGSSAPSFEVFGLSREPVDLADRLFMNDGEGHLVDETVARGAGDAHSGRASVMADFDDDGDLDIYVLNGASWLQDEPDSLYLNDGRGFFRAVPSPLPTLPLGAGRASSALALDPDGDGDLDLFLTHGDGEPPNGSGPYQLLKNESHGGHWLQVQLAGSHSERHGLGARLSLERPDGRILVREHTGGHTLFSQCLLATHFGLGSHTSAKRLCVRWPDGHEQVLTDVAADQRLVIQEDSLDKPAASQAAPPRSSRLVPLLIASIGLVALAWLIVRARVSSRRPSR